MPKYCTWQSKEGKWRIRKNYQTFKSLGRMYPVSPKETEKYHLRYLLLNVCAKSFKDLKTVNGIEYNTFGEACLHRGLTKNDDEWTQCLQEACHYRLPYSLRILFSNILIHCAPKCPEILYEKFKHELSFDYKRHHQNNIAEQKALSHIDF